MSFSGVEFSLTPANNDAQVAYKTNAQGQIVLELQHFSGSLLVSAVTLPATVSPAATRLTAKVEEEPHSPLLSNSIKSTTVSPGQQKLSFGTKKVTKKPRKRSSDASSDSSKKSRTTETPTQCVLDLSQTMPTETSTTPTPEGSSLDVFVNDDGPQNETVQEILDRVNSSSDSVVTSRDMDETNDSTMIVEEMTEGEDIATDNTTSPAADATSRSSYSSPCPRWGHTMTKLKDGRLLIYGGQSFDLQGNPTILSDVHVYNPAKRTWDKPINCRGEARQWHSATFLPERQLLLAFGGETMDLLGKKKDKVVTSDSLKVCLQDVQCWYSVKDCHTYARCSRSWIRKSCCGIPLPYQAMFPLAEVATRQL